MPDSTPVQFFDILSALPGPNKSWSPNTLKIRLALNYKRIPYTQSYISLPDIAPLLQSLSVPAHAPGTAPKPYTLPAIIHPSLKSTSNLSGAMMDSLPIALHLEEIYPPQEYPSIFPSGDASYALAVAVNELMRNMVFAGYALTAPRIADILDSPRGREYYIQTRSAPDMLGKPLLEIRPTDEAQVRKMVEEMKRKMGPIVQMLRKPGLEEKNGGPFFEGERPGLADFVFEAFMIWVKVADEDIWRELLAVGDGAVKALWDACYPWVEGQGEGVEWDIPQ
ncbi:hypothetical protein BDW75DRAFT_184924 [Aspergillus navahoensis]